MKYIYFYLRNDEQSIKLLLQKIGYKYDYNSIYRNSFSKYNSTREQLGLLRSEIIHWQKKLLDNAEIDVLDKAKIDVFFVKAFQNNDDFFSISLVYPEDSIDNRYEIVIEMFREIIQEGGLGSIRFDRGDLHFYAG
ncbi:hypothetical protein [Flammeovirga aprica]|uniref:Uncharacterized protein n=1 Tax=Flammeovirga aprica JL-4 TaxID=694437 RepID=A0A7X9P0X9_9BACT|nr:hypothetical protein [Flammeovirga aprica]NME66629.1 hypothetical protein [Flammeovirga aprica JL-4]